MSPGVWDPHKQDGNHVILSLALDAGQIKLSDHSERLGIVAFCLILVGKDPSRAFM